MDCPFLTSSVTDHVRPGGRLEPPLVALRIVVAEFLEEVLRDRLDLQHVGDDIRLHGRHADGIREVVVAGDVGVGPVVPVVVPGSADVRALVDVEEVEDIVHRDRLAVGPARGRVDADEHLLVLAVHRPGFGDTGVVAEAVRPDRRVVRVPACHQHGVVVEDVGTEAAVGIRPHGPQRAREVVDVVSGASRPSWPPARRIPAGPCRPPTRGRRERPPARRSGRTSGTRLPRSGGRSPPA